MCFGRIEGKEPTSRERLDFVMFGDPGSFSAPREVPTIRYVWTNSRQQIEDIVDSPYLPGARQDKRKGHTREGVSTGLFARMVQASGALSQRHVSPSVR